MKLNYFNRRELEKQFPWLRDVPEWKTVHLCDIRRIDEPFLLSTPTHETRGSGPYYGEDVLAVTGGEVLGRFIRWRHRDSGGWWADSWVKVHDTQKEEGGETVLDRIVEDHLPDFLLTVNWDGEGAYKLSIHKPAKGQVVEETVARAQALAKAQVSTALEAVDAAEE